MIQEILDDNDSSNKLQKQLIAGLDLSFNSTGITLTELENGNGQKCEFHRIVYETKPGYIVNINQRTYELPKNINLNDIADDSDFYSEDQAFITVKAMMMCKNIMHIIANKIQRIERDFPDAQISLYINIEGFVMPNLAGNQQLRVLGGLIMLQGIIRNDLIKYNIAKNFKNFKIFITSPSDLKLYFAGNGGADKQLMLDSFLEFYDGAKLLPDTSSLAKVNDVIDSFALMLNCYHKVFASKDFLIQKALKDSTKKAKKKLVKKTAKPKQVVHILHL